MGSPKYAGDTPLALDELEAQIQQTIKNEWESSDVQRMRELARQLEEVNMRRGIIKRQQARRD